MAESDSIKTIDADTVRKLGYDPDRGYDVAVVVVYDTKGGYRVYAGPNTTDSTADMPAANAEMHAAGGQPGPGGGGGQPGQAGGQPPGAPNVRKHKRPPKDCWIVTWPDGSRHMVCYP